MLKTDHELSDFLILRNSIGGISFATAIPQAMKIYNGNGAPIYFQIQELDIPSMIPQPGDQLSGS